MPTFARIYRMHEDREFLVNLDHISLIEIQYRAKNREGHYLETSVRGGSENPAAVRQYVFNVGGETFRLRAHDPSDPIIMELSRRYNDALKGKEIEPQSDG